MGPADLDVTTRCLVPANQSCCATICARQSGHLAGGALLPALISLYHPAIGLKVLVGDGQRVEPGVAIAQLAGPLAHILALERVALNYLMHLSGVATVTARYVSAVTGTNSKIFDTRKTLPGLRALEKYAVACGGGYNHRRGLYDAVLIKDNHIAHLATRELPVTLKRALSRARAASPPPRFVGVEVDTLEHLEVVLRAVPSAIDIVLLDNMALPSIRQAVTIRDTLAPGVELEASGGINLDTVAQIAATGVERISVGQITHSAVSLDLALDIV